MPAGGCCAAPVPDDGAYRHAALQTAMAMVSDLAGAQLAARDCPECTMSIPVAARRCPQCVAEITAATERPQPVAGDLC